MTDRLQAAREALVAAAEAVVWYDWSDCDDDVAESIDHLRKAVRDYHTAREALALLQSGPDTSRQSSETADMPDDVALHLMHDLHAHVPEHERPMAWSDFSDEQALRARAAARNLWDRAIAAALDAAAERQGWQDMATAPKDGTRVLFACGVGPLIQIGSWGRIGLWKPNQAEMRVGWRDDYGAVIIGAVNWRPLPAPPVSASKPEGA